MKHVGEDMTQVLMIDDSFTEPTLLLRNMLFTQLA